LAITTLLASLAVSGFTSAVPAAPSPVAHAAATCADYSDQAAAQQAADTRDADGDGIYCESLPCPCSNAAGGATKPAPANPTPTTSCTKPSSVQNITFSSPKYPTIRQHFLKALRKGWPRILVVNRPGADARRTRLLEDVPTRAGQDRDEYPPAVARGKGFHIRGINPRGWMADVAYVPSSENRSHGSTMGTKLRRFCNGTKFRYVFY
jgi:hypothetical protein